MWHRARSRRPGGQPRAPRPRPAPSATGIVKHAGFLTGVTCLPAGTCVAVGWYYYGATGPSLPLAIRWNGRAWLAEPAPSRGHHSQLDGVSCAAATSRLAVGTPAVAWTGNRWSIVPRPPAGPLGSVSCPVTGFCQAAGSLPAGARPVAARWNGLAWRAERVPRPDPVPQDLTLAAISCATARFCMTVGDASRGAAAMPSPAYRDRTLTERWNGTRWTVQRTQDIGHIGYSALTAVSCATAANCMAVGTCNGGIFGVAEHWDGSRWTIQRLPVPPVAPGEEPLVLPASVSCASATACVAVGSKQAATLAERWNGSTWAIEQTRTPPDGWSPHSGAAPMRMGTIRRLTSVAAGA